MNHQPFRSWLLSEEPLPPEQAEALRAHLQNCQACRQLETAWDHVNILFEGLPLAEPRPGFTARWEARLAAHRLQQQSRQVWVAVAVTAALACLLLLILGAQVIEVLSSPAQLALVWIARLSSLLYILDQIHVFITLLLKAAPAIPIAGAFFSAGMVCFLSVLWLATYRQLVTSRRILI